jgi:hypothetical protein
MTRYATTPSTAHRQPTPQLATRKPTGEPPYPAVLVEGPEKSGKSWAAAQLTTSLRIGQAFWIDWAEGSADEYAAIPGASYHVICHDGSWSTIVGQVAACHAEAARAAEAGEAPVLLVIDGMSGEWDTLKNYADMRARQSPAARRKLEKNPNAEISVPLNVWSDVHMKHRELMRMLLTFPGIVVFTARGKETAALDSEGRPIPGEKSYKVEGHKNLGYDASAWIRLSREAPPTVIGARSVHAGIRPGVDPARQVPELTLDWLVFDLLLSGSVAGHTRDLPTPQTAEPAGPADASTREAHEADQWDADRAELVAAGDQSGLRALYLAAREAAAPHTVLERIAADGKRLATHEGEPSGTQGQVRAGDTPQSSDETGEEQPTPSQGGTTGSGQPSEADEAHTAREAGDQR